MGGRGFDWGGWEDTHTYAGIPTHTDTELRAHAHMQTDPCMREQRDHTHRTRAHARTDAALARTQANKPASGVLNIPSEEFSKNWKLPPDFESANWLWKVFAFSAASFATCDSRRPRVVDLRASFPYPLVACLMDCADAIRSRLL